MYETPEGVLGGYAYVWIRDPSAGEVLVLGVVHPDHRERGLGRSIAGALEKRAAELLADSSVSDPVLMTAVPSGDERAFALFEARGYEEVRRFWRMEIDLVPGAPTAADPPGIAIEQVQPDLNAARVHDVVEDAFARHWRFVPQLYEEWRSQHVGRGDLPLWFIAYADGAAVGALVGSVESTQGHVDQIAVRDAFRRRGVARTLLLRAFAAFAEAGATGADLDVDAENRTGATALYEGVGMRPAASWAFLQKQFVPPPSP